MLADLDSVKLAAGVPLTDGSQDDVLGLHLAGADGAARRFCKRDLEFAQYTDYLSPRGEERLALRQRPAWLYRRACVLTQGSASATVTGASVLAAGMPAVLQNYLPVGCTVSAVAGSTVTLSAAALLSGSVTVNFGLSVWLDVQGYSGQAPGAFADASHLWPGVDFTLDLDSADGSRSALLVRLGGGPAGLPTADWPFGWWGAGRRGTLTARLAPIWPYVTGCVKAVYCAGYPADAVPADLKQAVVQLAVWLWRTTRRGGFPIVSQSYEGYSYALGKLETEPALGSTRQLLSRYREVAV